MFHRFLTIAAVVLLVGLLVSGCGGGGGGSHDTADFEGEWSGTLSRSGDGASMGMQLSLWMEGNALQGTFSNDAWDGIELDHVSVSGTKLSFHVPYDDDSYATWKGTLSGGDTISGTWQDVVEGSPRDHGTWEVERDAHFRVRSSETGPKPTHAAGSGKGLLGTK
ncbi:MAG: hypothetical protein ABFE08_11500 [Armatimonadia bacterium]